MRTVTAAAAGGEHGAHGSNGGLEDQALAGLGQHGGWPRFMSA
jgi:hypothetical protein